MRRLVNLGAPKDKLMLGIAFYGRTYVLRDPAKHGVKARIKATSRAEAGPYVNSHELMGYYEVLLACLKYPQVVHTVPVFVVLFSNPAPQLQ